VKSRGNQVEGYDVTRGYVMGRKNIKMRHFSEAYTTDNWIVRVYAVNDFPNREIAVRSRFKLKKNGNERITTSNNSNYVNVFNVLKMPRSF
jgi:hypothetical protein